MPWKHCQLITVPDFLYCCARYQSMNRNGTFVFAVFHPQRDPGAEASAYLIKSDHVGLLTDIILKAVFYY